MSRFLQIFNLLGVLALAALCCLQWRTNRLVNLRAIDLEKTRLEQVARLAEQDKAIKGYVADLDDFRQRLELSEAALKEAEEKFNAVATERDKLIIERDQLKANLDKWMTAVAARDAALKQAGEQLDKAAVERNDAISKFNDLADKYNAVVKELNNTRPKQ